MSTVLYRGVAQEMRRHVAKLQPGTRLPPEHALVTKFKVSRATIRAALRELAAEGLITSARGQGWATRSQNLLQWVASTPERNTATDVTPADSWSNGIRHQGRDPQEQIRTETLLADGQIADLLEVDPGTPVLARRRLRWVNEQLHTTADTYFPLAIVAGTPIELPAHVRPGTYAVMEAAGHGWRTYRDRLRARPPTADEADLFMLGAGVAVLEHVRVRRTADGRVVAVMITVLPGDRNETIYEGDER